jgi:hypothetical protein
MPWPFDSGKRDILTLKLKGESASVTLPPFYSYEVRSIRPEQRNNAVLCCALLIPDPDFSAHPHESAMHRLILDPISSRICTASAQEHPDPQLLDALPRYYPFGASREPVIANIANIPHSTLASPPKKGEREKEKGKKNQARQRQAKRE